MLKSFNKFEDNKSNKVAKYKPQTILIKTPYIVKSI
jgi:hypothetical protein